MIARGILGIRTLNHSKFKIFSHFQSNRANREIIREPQIMITLYSFVTRFMRKYPEWGNLKHLNDVIECFILYSCTDRVTTWFREYIEDRAYSVSPIYHRVLPRRDVQKTITNLPFHQLIHTS